MVAPAGVVVVVVVVKAMVWSGPVVKMSVDVSTIDEWAGVVVINAVDAEVID